MGFGKPSELTPTEYNAEIEQLVALKSDLASERAVKSFEANIGDHGRIRGRVALRHTESFFGFNSVLQDYDLQVVSVTSEDVVEDTADGAKRQVVDVRVTFLGPAHDRLESESVDDETDGQPPIGYDHPTVVPTNFDSDE